MSPTNPNKLWVPHLTRFNSLPNMLRVPHLTRFNSLPKLVTGPTPHKVQFLAQICCRSHTSQGSIPSLLWLRDTNKKIVSVGPPMYEGCSHNLRCRKSFILIYSHLFFSFIYLFLISYLLFIYLLIYFLLLIYFYFLFINKKIKMKNWDMTHQYECLGTLFSSNIFSKT